MQFTPKRLAEMAEAAHLLTTDAALREQVLAGQDERLAAFAPAAVEGALRGYLETSAGGDGAACPRADPGGRAVSVAPPGWPWSSSATAARSRADPSRCAAPWPSAWPASHTRDRLHDLRHRLRHLAQRAARGA